MRISKANVVTSKICHYAIAIPRLILRSGIEEKAKAERRMNEQRSKEYRTTIEQLSKKHLIFDYKTTKKS